MQVIFFGKLAERVERCVTVNLPEGVASIGELRSLLADRFPQARSELLAPSLRACVSDALVDDAYPLRGADTVEFFPPVSGG